MTRIVAILGQLVLILAGFVAASLAGSAALHLALFAVAGFAPEQLPTVFAASAIFSVPFVALFVGYFAFLPACAAILAAELFGLRSWLYHTLAGGVAGGLVVGLMWRATEHLDDAADGLGTVQQADIAPDRPLALVIVAAGLVGGFVYWAVAGRFSGGWKARPTAPAPSGS